MEHDGVVDAVQELRTEVLLEFLLHLRLHPLISAFVVILWRKAQQDAL